MTDFTSFLNIITELIAGYAWPGKPIANMMVKCYGYNSVKHGMDFAQDLKMGQYMKVPPRVLFFGQVYASVLATATQTGGSFVSFFFFSPQSSSITPDAPADTMYY